MSESDPPTRADPPARRASTPPPLLFQVDLEPESETDNAATPPTAHEINSAFERALGPALDPVTAAVPRDAPGYYELPEPIAITPPVAAPSLWAPVAPPPSSVAPSGEPLLAEPQPTEPLQLDPPESYIHRGGPSVDVSSEPEPVPGFGGYDHFAPFGQPFTLQPEVSATVSATVSAAAPPAMPPPAPPDEIDPFDAAFIGPTLSPIGEPPDWSPPVPGVPEPTPRHFVGPVSLRKQGNTVLPSTYVDPNERTGVLPPIPGERAGLLIDAPPIEHFFADHHDPFELGTWPKVATGYSSTRPQFGVPGPDLFAPAEITEDADADPSAEVPTGRHRGRVRTAERTKPAKPAKAAKAAKAARKAPWWELPALIGLAVLIAVVVKTFVVQPFYIPSASMEKTLHGCPGCSGDRILVNKPIYHLRDPHPGDIVVFNAPPGWNDEPGTKPPSNPILRTGRGFLQLIGFVPPDGLVLVKRVIAVAGQTVKGYSAGGKDVVQVSDHGAAGPWRTLVEPFVFIDPGETDANANFGPVTVPKGRLWVMGDHRNDSADSRFHCGPNVTAPTGAASSCDQTSSTVPISDVIGKAFVIAWPPSRWRTLGTPGTFSAGIVLPIFFVRRRKRRQHGRRRRRS